jgi:hypothetical protein
MEKILITGTGRAGTTFLIQIFTFLGYDTGFDETNFKNFISPNSNSGMEKAYYEKHYITKDPYYIDNIKNVVKDKCIKIKHVIIPVRDYKDSAKSRTNIGKGCGGLWNATNEEEQLRFYNQIMADYIYVMVKNDLSTFFLDFDRMVNDKSYLFEKLKIIFDEKNVDFDTFSKAYNRAASFSKKK